MQQILVNFLNLSLVSQSETFLSFVACRQISLRFASTAFVTTHTRCLSTLNQHCYAMASLKHPLNQHFHPVD